MVFGEIDLQHLTTRRITEVFVQKQKQKKKLLVTQLFVDFFQDFLFHRENGANISYVWSPQINCHGQNYAL